MRREIKNQKSKIKNNHKSFGFTLIELILVVSIILTISILSASFYARFLLQNAVANTTDQLVGSLRKAQIYSMESKQGSTWSVNYSNNAVILYKGSPPFASRSDPTVDEKFTINSNVAVSGLTDITFARMSGVPNSSLTITVSGNNNIKTVTVNSQGMVGK